jgi:hypothetical protein
MTTEDVDTSATRDGATPDALADPPVRRSPGMRPALLVLGIAAGLVVVFGVLAGVSGGGTHGTVGPTAPTRVKGTSLLAVPADKALGPIEQPGTPPDNIIDALTLPRGAAAGSFKDNNTSSTQYDEQMRFSVNASEGTVVDFYKVELKAKGWSIFSVGSTRDLPGGVEVLAQKGGTDGWYWEVGAVVSPTTFGRAGSGSGSESTAFTLRLFQEPDAD